MVQGAIDELNSNLNADGTPFRFGKDAEGNFGYILTDETGADSLIPFSKGIEGLGEIVAYYGSYSDSDNIPWQYMKIRKFKNR